MTDIKFFKDKDLKEQFNIENIGRVEAGDTKEFDGYLFNSSDYELIEINYETPDKDVSILELPESMQSRALRKVKIKYSPKEMRIKPLDTFVTFHAKKVIPPE